jgi:hypothetical protein
VGATVAAQIVEQDRPRHPAGTASADGIAGSLDTSFDAETSTKVSEHLGHERHALERARLVERAQDFRGRPDLD